MQFLIITLDFEKNANFIAENCQKSQKIVIITSTPVQDNYGNIHANIHATNSLSRLIRVGYRCSKTSAIRRDSSLWVVRSNPARVQGGSF
jgi:hypothetical protein